MLKNYSAYLISKCKKLAEQYNIFDVVLYGSAVKGRDEPRDTDLLLIFREEPLKERAKIAQNIKEILGKKISNIDIKTINLRELFEKDFLARQAILTEGYSLLYNSPLSERLGFKSYALFTYNLKNLNHNEKTKFTYALIGRKTDGITKQLSVRPLGKGAVIVPIKNSLIFESFLQRWRLNYKKSSILLSEF